MSNEEQQHHPEHPSRWHQPAPPQAYYAPHEYPEPEYRSGNDQLSLKSLLRIARKHRWMIAGITVVVTTLAAIDAYRDTTRYQATATIEIGQQSNTYVNGGEILYQEYDPLRVTMNTAEVLLTSAPLLEDVVVQLNLDENRNFVEANRRRSIMESIDAISGGVTAGPDPGPRVFEGTTTRIPIEGVRTSEEAEHLKPYVGIIQDNIQVRPILDTRAMTVSFTHADREIAARVTNAVAERFVQTSLERRIQSLSNASRWLDQSTRQMKAEVERAQQALDQYMRENNIFGGEGNENLITAQLGALNEAASRAQMDRIVRESVLQQVIAGRVDEIPERFADPQIVSLQGRLRDLEIERAELGATYGPQNPQMIELTRQMGAIRDQIAAGRSELEARLMADYDRAVREEGALEAALDRAKTIAAAENQAGVTYQLLKQDVDTNQALYTEFLQSTNQAQLEVAQQQNNIRIVAPARIPGGPVGPNRRRAIMVAFAMSLVGGMGLAWALERFNDSIRSVDDILNLTQLPALAVIPKIKTVTQKAGAEVLSIRKADKNLNERIQRARIMEFDGRSPTAEAFRALRTGLMLSAAGHPPRTIVVTSVRMEEGKTTTSTNIAIALAQLGKKVLLVDADLRKPSLHEIFQMSRKTGLSSILVGSDDIESAKQDPGVPNLHVIPAGQNPPNPAELLSSDRMKEFVEEATNLYDHVVVDSPPMGSVTDGVILSTIVDGVILVVQGGKSSRGAIQRASHEFKAVGAKVFGIVLNNVDLKKEGYDDYYYYSSYYAYGETRRERGA